MLSSIYPVISWLVIYALILFVALLGLRMVFNYADPNPFGSVGRFAFWLRKKNRAFRLSCGKAAGAVSRQPAIRAASLRFWSRVFWHISACKSSGTRFLSLTVLPPES